MAGRSRMAGEPGVTRAAALIAAVTLALVAGSPAVAERRAEVASVLRRMPDVSREAQATWLLDTARGTQDAHLAYDLLSELTRRYHGATAARARLWKVRFHMAAGDTASALGELLEVDDAPEVAAERAYWATLLWQGSGPGQVARAGTLPPWDLMRGIVALDAEEVGSRRERAALELEGAARRWGLLGPWLWRLARGDSPVLREVAEAILDAPHATLEASPEMAGLRGLYAREDERPSGNLAAAPEGSTGSPPGAATYSVEVGTFREGQPARELVRELAGHGFEAYLTTSTGPEGDVLHRVRIGRGCALAVAESLGTALGQQLMLAYQIVTEVVADSAGWPAAPESTGGALAAPESTGGAPVAPESAGGASVAPESAGGAPDAPESSGKRQPASHAIEKLPPDPAHREATAPATLPDTTRRDPR